MACLYVFSAVLGWGKGGWISQAPDRILKDKEIKNKESTGREEEGENNL